MENIKNFARSAVYPLWWRIRYKLPWTIDFFIERKRKKNSENYNELLKMKDKYHGERCFVVGTGPSLKMDDLELIKEEYSISVNSILLSFPDTEWRPTFYAIQDIVAYNKLSEQIETEDIPYVFCGVSGKKRTPPIKRNHINYQLDTLDHAKNGLEFTYKFSSDAYDRVYDGFSITYATLQLAVYMGFKEIILLGVDCDYSKEVNHIKAYSIQPDKNASYKMYQAYRYARNWADIHDIRIINATRNAKMDAFECKNLEDVLSKENL